VAVELMSAADEEFFDMDRDPRMVSNVGVVYVLEEEVPEDRMLAALLDYVAIVPRARQRVVKVEGRWAWADVETFEHEQHLEYRQVGPDASLNQIATELSQLYSRPWDMTRPLVRATVLRGLAGARSAVFLEVSHALGDGLGLLHSMRGTRHQPTSSARGATVAAGARDAARLLRHAVCDGGLRHSATAQLRSFAGHAGELAERRRWRTGEQSCSREIALMSVELEAWREAAERRNGRINDLFLAAAAAALRDTLGYRRRDPSTIDVVMPISIRPSDEAGVGNQVWRGLVRLPDGDPLRDLRVVARASTRASALEHLPVGPVPEQLLRVLPTRLRRGFMRRSLAAADGVATNLTFPFEPMEFAGTRVLEHYVVAPVTGPPVLFALCTYADVAHFSLTIDPGLLPEPDRMRERFAEIVELVAER